MTLPQDSTPLVYLPPTDVLAALGEMAVSHGYLDVVLRYTIATVCNVPFEEASRKLSQTGSAELRRKLERFATRRFGAAHPAVHRLQKILSDCKKATEQRNRWTHDPWAKLVYGGAVLLHYTGKELEIPSAAEVKALAQRLRELAEYLTVARQQGFIVDAISGTPIE